MSVKASHWGLAFTFNKVWFASYFNFLHLLNSVLIYALNKFINIVSCLFLDEQFIRALITQLLYMR